LRALFDIALEFFRQDDWPIRPLEGQTSASVNFGGRNGQWTCYLRVIEDKYVVLFYSMCPVKAPPEKRPILADFLTRANYGLYLGNFEMDYNDGEVRFKTSLDVEGDHLTNALMKRLTYNNVTVMDRYLPGIFSVIYGGASPTEAIAQVEG
jgi:hypothetical protein